MGPIARSFLHPVTQAKFTVLTTPAELKTHLTKLIDWRHIPPYFGGVCACAECRCGRLRGGSMLAWETGDSDAQSSAALSTMDGDFLGDQDDGVLQVDEGYL